VDFATLKAVLAAFEREGVRYAVFGAAALNLHGLARFTEDLDVFLEPTSDLHRDRTPAAAAQRADRQRKMTHAQTDCRAHRHQGSR
jgi:hypothetical protein